MVQSASERHKIIYEAWLANKSLQKMAFTVWGYPGISAANCEETSSMTCLRAYRLGIQRISEN